METLTSIPFAVCFLGLLIWFIASDVFASPPKPQSGFWIDFGRVTYFAGLLITLAKMAGKSVL